MFDIRIYGDPILRTTGKSVESFDDELNALVDEMIVTMREKDGVGLAANQVGKAIQIAVIDTSGGMQDPYVLINPQIIAKSGELANEEEGCLSIPTIRATIKRPARVTAKALDRSGKEYVIENAEGLLARALQHEIDHLNGIMFVDHLSPLQRSLIGGKLKKLARSGDKE